MNCPGCGAELKPSEQVCPGCGRAQAVAPRKRGVPLPLLLVVILTPLLTVGYQWLQKRRNIADAANVPAPAPELPSNYPCVTGPVEGAAPRLGQCALYAAPAGPVDRMEADLRYGRFVLRETDLYLDDDFQVPLTRTYNSLDWVHPNPVHAFGRNSNHPFDIAPLGTRNPYTYMMLVLEDGDFVYFDRISKGAGFADAVFRHSESSTRFYKAVAQWNGYGWRIALADGTQIDFPDSNHSTNMAQGAPIEIRNARGERLQLIRDGQRNLQEILTPHGRWIKFQYDDMSRVIYAADDAGHWAKYTYTPEGMLGVVLLSSGRQRTYEYDGDKMTRILDGNGHELVRNVYASGQLVGQQFADGSAYSYAYTMAPSGKYIQGVTVTPPNAAAKFIPVVKYLHDFVADAP